MNVMAQKGKIRELQFDLKISRQSVKGLSDYCTKYKETIKELESQVKNLTIPNVSKRFWHFDTWDKTGYTQTITIEAMNEENATIILKALHEDIGFDKPY